MLELGKVAAITEVEKPQADQAGGAARRRRK
jgi:hypothetical protein